MKLSVFTDYCVRVLLFAAARHGQLCQVQAVAEAHKISRSHLVKCVHQLGQWGYLENVRGRGGGFRLAKPADEILLGDVVRSTEEYSDVWDAFSRTEHGTHLLQASSVRQTFASAFDAFFSQLDQMTLDELARRAPSEAFEASGPE